MPISEAKLLANRKNAARSTGPKTPEGKARSRQNALKHGLTGSGVALPSEDQAEIAGRFTELQMQMRPKTDAGEQLLRRFAFLTVRMERSERHETAQTAMRVRHAIEKFDDERLTFVEGLATKIYTEPATSVRRLQMSPEGIDWMLDEWETLRSDLLNPDRNCWTGNHRMHFDALLGRNPGGYRTARTMALSYAMDGSFHLLDKADGEGLDGSARAAWAKDELTRQIDTEMARLKEVRARIDMEALAMDRAEAADRALFDPSPEAVLARKYEAATERAMYRTLKEFRQVEAEAAEVKLNDCEVEEDDPVGSNFEEPVEEAPVADSTPSSVDFAPSDVTVLDFSIGKRPEMGSKPPESINES